MLLGITESWRWTAYRYIITLALSLKFLKNSQQKCWKLPLSTTPLSFDAPPRESQRISAWTLYRQKLESLAYNFVGYNVGLSSFKLLWWAPKDASFLQQSAYRPYFSSHPSILKPMTIFGCVLAVKCHCCYFVRLQTTQFRILTVPCTLHCSAPLVIIRVRSKNVSLD